MSTLEGAHDLALGVALMARVKEGHSRKVTSRAAGAAERGEQAS